MSSRSPASERVLLLGLSILPVTVCLAALLTPGYSYFIDEFYYLSCARRLAWGYVDHPPLAPFILALVRAVLGESLLAVRLLPALATGGTVYLTGLIVRRLGGTRPALVLAGLSVGLMPLILAMGSIYSMNAFEPLLWTATMLVLLRIVQGGDSRLWLLVGVLIGLGFENKHTVVPYVAALGVGMALTDARKMLRNPWVYAGGLVALVIAAPNILWQVANGWPSLEFYRKAQIEKNVYSPPLRSFLALAVAANPLALPVWGAGLWALLRGRLSPGVRVLGVTALVAVLEYLASGSSRPDRPAATLPLLCAAGAVAIEMWATRRRLRGVPIALAVGVSLLGAVTAPLLVPLMPPPTAARYTHALGVTFQAERGKTSPIPQMIADRTGWESFIEDVRRVHDTLTPEERKRAVVFVPDYGHAGALELWGPSRGLPRVICNHNTFWHWSAANPDAEVLIAVDADERDLREFYSSVQRVGLVTCEYCMSWRSQMPVYVAKGPKIPLREVWARTRHYE